MHEYEEWRWLENFRMMKQCMLHIARILWPHLQKYNTLYCKVVPIVVKVACALFKLTQGVSFFLCFEMFSHGKSIVCMAIQDFVQVVNIEFRSKISWPKSNHFLAVMAEFKK